MREDFYNEAKKIFVNMGDDVAQRQLDHLQKNKADEKFKICIAGGFSRGKTHLVNQLLDTGIFPEDVVPATTVLTSISYGNPASLTFVGTEEKNILEPTTESLEKFCAGNERSDAEGILQVGYPAPFLEPNLVIYDTPGIDDILARRADITFEALERCDAALVVTSANSPLSLTERQFIESYLFNRHIPKIALVVTFIDQLDESQARRQLENIKASASRLFQGMEIWCALQTPATQICDASGIKSLQQHLHDWAQSPLLEQLRAKRDLTTLAKIAASARSIQEGYLQNLSGDYEKRQEKLRQAVRALRENSEGWNELRNAFMDRAISCAEGLQKKIAELAPALREAVENDSSQEVAATLREKARFIQDAICETMRESLHNDKTALLSGLREKYDFIPDLQADARVTLNREIELPDNVGKTPGLNGALWEMLDFLQKHIDDVAIVLPLPPLPKQIARKVANELLERGKEFVGAPAGDKLALGMEIEKFCSSLEKELMTSTRHVYADIAEQVRHGQMKWLEMQKRELGEAVGAGQVNAQIEKCKSNIAAVDSLLEKIKAVM